MTKQAEPEVLVVGAGPVGLTAALFLTAGGSKVEIVDRERRTTQFSYALAIHPSTITILEELGLAAKLIATGRKVHKLAFYEGSERHAELDYRALGSGHPYLLVLRQSSLERALEEELNRRGVQVEWGHRLESLKPEGDAVEAGIAKLDQVAAGYPIASREWVVVKRFERKPAFVIGADGYDSSVRRFAGFEMAEYGGGQVFSVYEIEVEGEVPDEVRVTLDPDTTSVYWPLEPGRCRWGFQVRDASGHSATLDRLEQHLKERAPWFTGRPKEVYWSTLALFEWRLARRLGRDRIWLAGDAAHQAAPVGVQSMNGGLREARELASCMGRILHGNADGRLLEEFGTDTHATWEWLLGAGRGVEAIAGADPWVALNRARIVAAIPASGADRAALLGQIRLQAPTAA